MARQHSSKEFFRQAPNALLGRYFSAKGSFAELDFSAMPEGNPVALFNAWMELPDNIPGEREAELREIFELSSERGYLALLDEMQWQYEEDLEKLNDLKQELEALPEHYSRAMVVFLDPGVCIPMAPINQ